jgi:N-acetyl sugar amidotransferase
MEPWGTVLAVPEAVKVDPSSGMKYCATCITPWNRPNLRFDAEGRCNCATAADKREIDWAARERDFLAVVDNAKRRSRGYDCVVPVSGGKDSTWQIITCLEHGLKPLAVTWRAPGRTAIGQQNLDNLIRLGVDHIDYSINPEVEKTFTLRAFEKYGSTAVPMHMAIFSIPLQIAVKFGIPLVVWGENSAFEYGGTGESRTGFKLDAAWLKAHGVTHGTTARDWVGVGGLTERDLVPYFGPDDAELERAGVLAVFLGYYFAWDPEKSLEVATRHGFQRNTSARTGYYDYADIDDDFISLHHWLKWYKFGFTRTFDNLSLEVRNGRMTRAHAIAILKQRGDETPHEDIAKFCAWVGITRERFFEIAETFRNRDVWTRRGDTWVIEDFLVPDWAWT